MGRINNLEQEALISVKKVANTYKSYQENFEDSKLEEIRNLIIKPISDFGNQMIEECNNLNRVLDKLLDENMIDEK